MQNLVILTGAGISAESGLKTFRDADGLWEGHDVMKVATPQGWAENTELVLRFYNERRKLLQKASPNAAHKALARLENNYNVSIITQNVDDLHERAGSTNVLHLHGELKKVRSSIDESLVYNCEGDIQIGDLCEKGSQLRPHVVWFGEMVPLIEIAAEICIKADIFMVIGTSMVVYPAAGLIHYVPEDALKYVIDPKQPAISGIPNLNCISETAVTGVPQVADQLIQRTTG